MESRRAGPHLGFSYLARVIYNIYTNFFCWNFLAYQHHYYWKQLNLSLQIQFYVVILSLSFFLGVYMFHVGQSKLTIAAKLRTFQ